MDDTLIIKIDSDKADSDVDKLREKLKKLTAKKYKVEVQTNTGHYKRKLTTLEKMLKRLQGQQKISEAALRAEKELIRLERQKQREIMKTNTLLKKQAKSQASGMQYQQKQQKYHGGFSNITRKGLSGSGGDYISQMPQNPMLGRFAQFGMMASGMAATIFLMQMIAAQIANLMETIISWEESVLNIIEKTDATSKNMDKLSDTIRSYAGSMGVDQVAVAGAYGAATEYGISPSQKNIEQLYQLNSSNLIKDYKQAAIIMTLAGTEMGDKFADQATKRWEVFSNKNGSSGTFGYEWGNLKSSAKEGLFHVWNKEDTEYGKQMTDTMRQISDWVKANRQTVGSVFDGLVISIKAVVAALKYAMPALIVFSGAFLAVNSWKILDWMLVGISQKIMALGHGFAAATTSIAGFKAAFIGLGATLNSVLPAAAAFVAIWAAWKIGKDIYKINSLNNAIKKASDSTAEGYQKMSSAQREASMEQSKAGISQLTKSLNKQKDFLKDLEKAQSMAGSGFESDITKTINQIQKLESKIKIFKKDQDEITKANNKELFGVSLPDNVTVNFDQWQASLKTINQELGYIPDHLHEINNATASIQFNEMNNAVGSAPAGAVYQSSLFKNKLAKDVKLNKKYQTGLNIAAINDPGGFSDIEKQIYFLKELKKQVMSSGQTFDSMAGQLSVINTAIGDLKIKKATDDLADFIRAADTLNNVFNKLDLTNFEKTMYNIDKQFGNMDTSGMKSDHKAIWTKQLQDQLLTWQGKDPELTNWIKDVKENSNLDTTTQDQMIQYRKSKEELVKLEFKLNVEKGKGLKFASAQQTMLEQQIKDIKARMRYNIGLIKPEDYQQIVKYNKELKDFTDALNDAQRDRLVGFAATMGQGGAMSDIERDAIIREKQLRLAKSFASKDIQSKYSKNQLDDLQGKANAEIEKNALEEQLRTRIQVQRESTSVMEQHYQIRSNMTGEHYDAQQRIINDTYELNKSKAGVYYAEVIKKEQEFQLKVKNRRNLSQEEDIALGIEGAAKRISNAYKTAGEMVERTMVHAFDGAANAMTQWIMGTKDAKEAFKDMARSILTDITNMIIKQQMLNLLLGSGYASGSSGVMGGILGGIGNFFGFADGGVASGISAYRNQIVSSPTFVPGGSKVTAYATGGALFGEAGPEAIMPLTKMPSGNLGVEASASSPNVEINIKNNGNPVNAKQDGAARFDGKKWVIDIVLDHAANNIGGFQTSMKGLLNS